MSEANHINMLVVDTSTPVTAMGIISGAGGVEKIMEGKFNEHSSFFLPLMETLCRETEIQIENIEGVAITVGPGSFTGLRIGMAFVKGLFMGTDIPIIPLSTLEILPEQCGEDGMVCSVLDARRGEVYAALFEKKNGLVERKQPDRLVSPDDLVVEIPEGTLWIGNAASPGRYRELFQEQARSPRFAREEDDLETPHPLKWRELCLRKYKQGESINVQELIPRYIRSPDAKIKRKVQ